MKTITLFLFLGFGVLWADTTGLASSAPVDWTVQGKIYHNVIVGKVEADWVHITYDGGIGAVSIADLPPDVQKQLGFDPQKAVIAEQQRAYEEEISDLKAKVANLQNELARYKSTVQEQIQAPVASTAKPSRQGYLYFYNDLLNRSGDLWGRKGLPAAYTKGPFFGMTEGEGKAYAQQQWATLSQDQKIACEQNAGTYGTGPDPDAPKPPGQYAPAPPTHQYQVTPTGGGGATITGY